MKLLSRTDRSTTSLAAVLIVLSAFTAASFSACRNSGQPSAKLSLAVNAGVEGDALKQAARDYESQTGVRVNISEFPYDDLFSKELIDLKAATGAYDLIMLDDPWFPRFATEELLTNLAPLLQRRGFSGPDPDFVASSIALCRHPYETGALFALPYVGNSQLFFYRSDLFKKHNLKEPATWDDVLNAARTIDELEKNGAPGGGAVHGYVMRAARGNSAVADFMPIFWAFGAEMFGANGHPTVNSAEGISALRFMLELGKHSPPGYASFNATEVSAHLLQGTAAMSINWPAWIGSFSDPAKSRVIGKMAFTTMPGAKRPGQAEIGNWLIAVPRASRNVEAAMDFLLWTTAAEQMKKSAFAGNPPTRTSVFADTELISRFPAYPAQLRSLETSRPRPRTPMWNEIENVFGIFLARANGGELTAEEAMNQANDEIAKIVARAR
ncbi:MAG: extracellular solute-binding protein [Acidobacteriota bacterium]